MIVQQVLLLPKTSFFLSKTLLTIEFLCSRLLEREILQCENKTKENLFCNNIFRQHSM
jgi:hypothetical protein